MVQLLQQSNPNPINNNISYSTQEDMMWSQLYKHQVECLQGIVYEQFFELLEKLNLPKDRVPQLHEVSRVLKKLTGWTLTKVDGLISYNDFFYLLANKVFPSTTYLRKSSQFSKDPDIFHELFGHCPMLLDYNYSNFLKNFAKFALDRSHIEQILLQRLLWFTIEVGLIKTNNKISIYGGALISSPKESLYVIDTKDAEKKPFDFVEIFRSPYRADILQTTYYFINDLSELYDINFTVKKLSVLIEKAKKLGEYPAKFKVENNKYSNVAAF